MVSVQERVRRSGARRCGLPSVAAGYCLVCRFICYTVSFYSRLFATVTLLVMRRAQYTKNCRMGSLLPTMSLLWLLWVCLRIHRVFVFTFVSSVVDLLASASCLVMMRQRTLCYQQTLTCTTLPLTQMHPNTLPLGVSHVFFLVVYLCLSCFRSVDANPFMDNMAEERSDELRVSFNIYSFIYV